MVSYATFSYVAFVDAMQAGAEVNRRDDSGVAPLNYAAAKGHIACVDGLLQVCVTCSCFALLFVLFCPIAN